eukprot:4302277-Pyramimonas_sp.AAC.1
MCNESGFMCNESGFMRNEGGFMHNESGFMCNQSGFMRNEGGFMCNESGFMRNESGFMRNQSGFMCDESGFMCNEGGLGPTLASTRSPSIGEPALKTKSPASTVMDTNERASGSKKSAVGAAENAHRCPSRLAVMVAFPLWSTRMPVCAFGPSGARSAQVAIRTANRGA